MTNMDHIMVHMGELGRVKRRAVPKKERHGSLFLYKPTKQPDQGHMAQTWIENDYYVAIWADEASGGEGEWVTRFNLSLPSYASSTLCLLYVLVHIVRGSYELVGSLCAQTDINVRRFCTTSLCIQQQLQTVYGHQLHFVKM